MPEDTEASETDARIRMDPAEVKVVVDALREKLLVTLGRKFPERKVTAILFGRLRSYMRRGGAGRWRGLPSCLAWADVSERLTGETRKRVERWLKSDDPGA